MYSQITYSVFCLTLANKKFSTISRDLLLSDRSSKRNSTKPTFLSIASTSVYVETFGICNELVVRVLGISVRMSIELRRALG